MTLEPSFLDMIWKLSKLQRDFLVDHVDTIKPFCDNPIENMTRESLIVRKLVRYEPETRSRLGVPTGTVLTTEGRIALCTILGQYAEALMRAATARNIDHITESELLRVLTETATHWNSHHQ